MPKPPKKEDLSSLLPEQVEIVLSAEAPVENSIAPAIELAAAGSMKPRRRSEFMHGRTCARSALARLGYPDQPIPVGDNREPVWPDGIVGSISHCGPVAAAAIARNDEICGIGIDLELDEPLDLATLELICGAAEVDWLGQTSDIPGFAKLIFSAKESIFKCIWPSIRRYVDFREIGIRIDVSTNSFSAAEWSDELPASTISPITGRYKMTGEWIITTAFLPRTPSVA